jgi:corrinoid protein of di/trimethylamine methyltransferase
MILERGNEEEIIEQIKNCIVNIKFGEIKKQVEVALRSGLPAYRIFTDAIAKGLDIVGQKYECGEYFLSELMGAAEVSKEALKILEPHLHRKISENVGTVVVGTVKGDLHDIGKNIFKMLLTAAGFKVYDLGVDVPAQKFVEKVKETNANIVGLSALLTTTIGEIKNVIDEFKNSGWRDKVKIIVGGAAVSEDYAQEIGADGYGADAAQGVRICKEWTRKVSRNERENSKRAF